MLCLVELEVDIDDSEITTLQQFSGKSATNGLHFFVRYDNMYCSDAQMSLLEKQVGIWKKVSYKVKLKA